MVAAKLFERIWNKINELSRRPDADELGFRPAEVKDINFIFSEVMEGAEDGHYNETLLLPPYQETVKKMLRQVIQRGKFERISQYGLESIEGKLWVCGTSKLGYVGYCLIAQKSAKETEILEILKLGVTKQHQKKGHGKHIISFCMTLLPKNRKLYARCYPQSEPAYQMLKGCGFRHVSTTPGGTRELLFEPLN